MLKNQKGMALPLALVILLVLSLLGVALWQYSVAEANHATRDEKRLKAHYLARSGADAMAEYIVKNPKNAHEIITKTSESAKAAGTLGTGNFEVNVSGSITTGLVITSTGTSGDTEKTLTLHMSRLGGSAIFRNAIFTHANLNVTQMHQISGSLESAGTVYYPSNYTDLYNVTHNSTAYYPSPDVPTLPFRDPLSLTNQSPPHTIYENGFYSKIDMNNQSKLIFDTKDGLLQVVVDTLETNGDVEVIGNGRLELYITHKAEIQTPIHINTSDPNKMFIYVSDGKSLTIHANASVRGYVYAPYANVYLQSDSSTVTGAIIANAVSKSNGNPSNGRVVYHPISDDIDNLPGAVMFKKGMWRD